MCRHGGTLDNSQLTLRCTCGSGTKHYGEVSGDSRLKLASPHSLSLCVVASGEIEIDEHFDGTHGTRGVFGCAAHGHAVKGDSAHVCHADDTLG